MHPCNAFFVFRCEVIAYVDKNPTPVASGFVKNYASHIGAVAKQLQSGAHVILLDPRTRAEYSDGSLDGSCHSWFTLRTIRRFVSTDSFHFWCCASFFRTSFLSRFCSSPSKDLS